MDQGYKHFSHLHNLIMHQMPEGIDVPCSGCHSSATGTVYVCWQCNFFLHDQCYRATRSLKHPSHPPHPLTLVPYPTYHSNSFYCNSCEIIGTGFSYSCADCEFDLHVQCAYSISGATSFFENAHQFQELLPPGWNGNAQYHSMSHDLAYSQNSTTNALDPFMAHNLASVSIPMGLLVGQTGPFVSNTTNYPPNMFPSSQDPTMLQGGPAVSVPTSSLNRTSSSQYPSIDQSRPSFSDPNPLNQIPSVQDPSMHQDGPSAPIIPTNSNDGITSSQYPYKDQTGASFSDPTNPQDQFTSVQGPSMPQNQPSVSVPTNYQLNSTPCTEDHSTPQTSRPSVSIPTSSHNSSAQFPSLEQTRPSVPIPTNPSDSITTSHDPSILSDQNGLKDKQIIHFSHPHILSSVSLQEDEETEVICSGCEETLVGNGYSCVEPDCNFRLHESCFHLKKQIHHKSHPEHPLTLLLLALNGKKDGEFTCNACFSDGTGFTYHCSICIFDLHIQCVSLPETAKRDDHKHMLKLFYSCPVKDEEFTFSCDVCHGEVQKDRWVYFCESCDYGTHLGCVDCEECERDSILDAQAHLQRLQIRMEMARQQSQFMASLAASISNSYV
ncbi:hypothetical protein SSX86_028223 [Deinandra increscens subsp. villosa]|uniref:DC1 domain-containing protein n=1 Tax=Deinandra increscens subsp. villosa TaxID=3103831 RepID=A0AAP0C7K7_9ASTR